MNVHVLFRYAKKTGRIDTTLTGINVPLLKLYALQNTTKTKNSVVIERDTGKIVFLAEGTDFYPEITDKNLGYCTDYGIPLETVQGITDERFD